MMCLVGFRFNIVQHKASASSVILPNGKSIQTSFSNLAEALTEPDTQIKLFGKPEINGTRRMGVALARAETIEQAVEKANKVASSIKVYF